MKNRVRAALLSIALLLPVTLVYVPQIMSAVLAPNPDKIDCALDSFQMTRTGTKLINGKEFDVYKCPKGHETLLERK